MNTLIAMQLVRNVCSVQHLAWKTEKTYCGWLKRYCDFIAGCGSNFDTSEKRVEAFLSDLARRDVSASTQNQAFNAVLFFYTQCLKQKLNGINSLRARRPSFIRYAPSRDEVASLLREVQDVGPYPTRLLVYLLYGCGLRVGECVSIRIRDIDLANSRLVVKQAKGGKDRIVPLPCNLMKTVSAQIDVARTMWQADVRNGVPVQLPHLLATKYPRSALAWAWYWLTPLHTVSREPRTGRVVRWHCLDQSVQRAVRVAADRIGAGGTITPHCLRHAYATHAMRMGANVRDVQMVMGHAHLDTTMGYLHPEIGRVQSPLEALSIS